MHFKTQDHFCQLKEQKTEVVTNTTPKKITTNKAQILRDPVPQSMLEDIIISEKPKGVHRLLSFLGRTFS